MSVAIASPDWIQEQQRLFERAVGCDPANPPEATLAEFTASLSRLRKCWLQDDPPTESADSLLQETWDATVCDPIRQLAQLRKGGRQLTRAMSRVVETVLDQVTDLARTVLLSKPEWNLRLPEDLEHVVWTIRIPPLAYLRACFNLFWSALRHPLSETTIDLSTGHVLYRT